MSAGRYDPTLLALREAGDEWEVWYGAVRLCAWPRLERATGLVRLLTRRPEFIREWFPEQEQAA